jgi:hypothetical protein
MNNKPQSHIFSLNASYKQKKQFIGFIYIKTFMLHLK